MNPQVDAYMRKVVKWQSELEKLRMIILDCGLTEELKWAVPCYSFPVIGSGRSLKLANIVGINGLKESCALAFFKGALLQDAEGILTKPGKYTQMGRWIKFASVKEIAKAEPLLKAYIYEAIEIEKSGLKLKAVKATAPKIPDEFQQQLDEIPALKKAFKSLTPGRQRAYILYFSAAKQSKTRQSRIEKCKPQILLGIGFNEQSFSRLK